MFQRSNMTRKSSPVLVIPDCYFSEFGWTITFLPEHRTGREDRDKKNGEQDAYSFFCWFEKIHVQR
jgi:hypothetical protein